MGVCSRVCWCLGKTAGSNSTLTYNDSGQLQGDLFHKSPKRLGCQAPCFLSSLTSPLSFFWPKVQILPICWCGRMQLSSASAPKPGAGPPCALLGAWLTQPNHALPQTPPSCRGLTGAVIPKGVHRPSEASPSRGWHLIPLPGSGNWVGWLTSHEWNGRRRDTWLPRRAHKRLCGFLLPLSSRTLDQAACHVKRRLKRNLTLLFLHC